MSTIAQDTTSQKWNIDPAHASVDFSVKHMGVFTVRGSLGAITGTAETASGVLTAVTLSIDATGITTSNEQRDTHLKSADFLNVEQYPVIEFRSTAIAKSGAGYAVTGDLTIVGRTQPITVEVEIVEPVKDPWGNTRSGATGSSELARSEWGLKYNSVMDSGHMVLSDIVKFTFDIQAVVAS